MKNSNDTLRNRTRDLPACSAVPQPTAPPRTPSVESTLDNFNACPAHLLLFWLQPTNAQLYITTVSLYTIHTPTYLFININQLEALNFIISLFQASTCFEHMCSSSGGQNCIIQSLVSSHL